MSRLFLSRNAEWKRRVGRSLAHTTQFAKPGWRMLSHDAGTSLLAGGGSIVTRLSPDRQDWSAVIEKMSTKNSVCARGSNPQVRTT